MPGGVTGKAREGIPMSIVSALRDPYLDAQALKPPSFPHESHTPLFFVLQHLPSATTVVHICAESAKCPPALAEGLVLIVSGITGDPLSPVKSRLIRSSPST